MTKMKEVMSSNNVPPATAPHHDEMSVQKYRGGGGSRARNFNRGGRWVSQNGRRNYPRKSQPSRYNQYFGNKGQLRNEYSFSKPENVAFNKDLD